MQTHTSVALAALTAFFAGAEGHMVMKNPKPFAMAPDSASAPLSGSNYPCKLQGDPATFYKSDGIDNTMAVGETQTLEFTGSAVHGGGSCQLAITKDLAPSASTSWQVILSIEGGCPSKSGQGADTYDWKIPEGVAAGQYVFAWTWIAKMSGVPEYYMNCAPITVTGGSAKRSANETMDLLPRDGDFPELFVANLATVNDCKTVAGDPEYPNPGPNVERPGASTQFTKVTGSNCVPKGATEVVSGGGDSGADSGSGSGSDSGSDSGSGSTSTTAAAADPTTAPASGFVTSTKAATTAPATVETTAVASTAPAATSSAAAGDSSGVSGGLTGPCTEEGTFNCIGGSSYQQCASGSWSSVQAMPATTKCSEGQSTTLWGRDRPARSLNLRRRRS